MATRAEQFRTQMQRESTREAKRSPQTRKPPRGDAAVTKPRRTPRHASYALELPAADGRRSRKSTRDSANRAKPDTSFNLREALVKGSPEARFRKANAKRTRVRASKA
jgi:hypothetical protein